MPTGRTAGRRLAARIRKKVRNMLKCDGPVVRPVAAPWCGVRRARRCPAPSGPTASCRNCRRWQFASGNIIMVLLLAASIGQGADNDPPLQRPQQSAEYAKLRDLVLPNPREHSDRKMDWRTSVLRALLVSQQHDGVVMTGSMNGHPLGWT